MRPLTLLLLLAILPAPSFGADCVVKKSKHADAVKTGGFDQPAKDSTEVTWIGKDRMRVEEGDHVTIVRNDLKKLYLIDSAAKTYKVVDLPVDMKKYAPPDSMPDLDAMLARVKVSMTPTTETKKVKDWNTTRFTFAMTVPKPRSSTFTEESWVTKDVPFDTAAWNDMNAAILCVSPVGGKMATEMRKLEGFPVLVERTQLRLGTEFKARDEVTLVEQKEPAADLYEVPKDYSELPFQPLGDPGEIRGSIRPVQPDPGDKPGEKQGEKQGDKPVPR